MRHPMYASALLYLLGTPLALGSFWGLLPFVAVMPFLIWRLYDEERFLGGNLSGYREYQKKVQHRLLPYIWQKGRSPRGVLAMELATRTTLGLAALTLRQPIG